MRRNKLLPALVACIFAFVSSASLSQDQSKKLGADADGDAKQLTATLFFNARVFDGTELIENTNVLVSDGKIRDIGSEIKVIAGTEITRIDCEGLTLLPGLIDSHTHAFFEGHLVQAAQFGVTTEFDMMSIPVSAASLRQSQTNRADYFSAGAAVTVENGHGTQFGFPVPTMATPEEANDFIAARIREGSDYIKIIYDDGEHFGGKLPTLSREMVGAAIQAAQSQDRLAVCHIGGLKEANDAIVLKANGLVHLCADKEMPDELVELAVKNGLFVVPTAAVISNVSGEGTPNVIANDPRLSQMLNAENLANLQRTFPKRPEAKNSWETLKTNIQKLHKAGVPILAGTDAANPGTIHGASMLHEIILLTEAGLDNTSALRAATSVPATQFGHDDRGKIAKGLNADILLVKGNPIEQIADIKNIHRVWKSGVEVDIDVRIARVASEKERMSSRKTAEADLLVSGFDDGEATTKIGAGWQESTDVMMGGDSTVELSVVKDGAEETTHSYRIAGVCREEQPAFSGAMFSPGAVAMQAGDISGYKTISFWAKGNGEEFSLMLFFQKRGFMPSQKSFRATEEWKQYKFPIAEFDGCDGTDVLGMFFGSGRAGEFEFQIDQVELLIE